MLRARTTEARRSDGGRRAGHDHHQPAGAARTSALCIAFFYAIGTAVGGITGPLLFGALIEGASESKDITQIAVGYFIGAALMVIGGVVEILLGVKAEGRALESIARPLTAQEAEGDSASATAER